ncbi:unnamed protein product [Camellia sinensis]
MSSSDSRPCFLAYGDRGPVLYSVNFVDEKTYKKRKFCRRCCIDIHDGDEESKDGKAELDEGGLRLLSPLKSKKSSWFPSCSIVVALGSVVYALGGMIKCPNKKFEVIYSRECFYFDTNRPKGGWIRGPHMLNGRDGGKAAAVEGKIYVFGGVDLDYAPEPWAEVFDPINKKWEALPRPPDELEDCIVLQAATYGGPLEEKKIMVGGSFKYVYHLNSSSWEYLRNIHLNNCHENIIGAGNFMYWTDMGYLCVVNMESGSYYGGEIKGYRIGKYRDRYECEPTLLHLGRRKFCLLTLHDVRGGRWGDRCKIWCAKFEVSKLIDGLKNIEDNLIASIVCRDTYIVDQSLGCWHGHWHGLVLDGMLDGIKNVEESVSKEVVEEVTIDNASGDMVAIDM